MRISDWSSDVCSSDLQLGAEGDGGGKAGEDERCRAGQRLGHREDRAEGAAQQRLVGGDDRGPGPHDQQRAAGEGERDGGDRSEEHTSELQSLMRISYAVFCLKKKKKLK